MKEAVTGYITALINTHSRILEQSTHPISKGCNRQIVSELDDLLDFIEDIPEDISIQVTIKGDE
ncbi:hypothetical protein [Clostridium sp. DL1XJH146]